MDQEVVNVICLKWGVRYPSFYVNRLYAGVKKHLSRPFRFICVTDDPFGLDPEIEDIRFQDDDVIPEKLQLGYFTKLLLTKDGYADFSGPTLFLDIDQVIVGSLDKFFDYKPGRNCIIHNWLPAYKTLFREAPIVGNSSVFRFEAGKSHYIYETFCQEWEQAIDRKHFRTEQAFLTHAMGENREWWPEEWVQSVKRHMIPTFPLNLFMTKPLREECSIACFHGNPDPTQLIGGFFKGKAYRWMKEPEWFYKNWVEVEYSQRTPVQKKASWGYTDAEAQRNAKKAK